MSKNTVVAPAVSVESLIAEHEATPGAKRRTLRDSWTARTIELFMAGDADTAKVYAEAVEVAKSSKSTGPASESVDWRQITADRVAALRVAADLIESGQVRPAGTPDDIDLTDLGTVPQSEETLIAIAAMGNQLAGVRLAGQRNVPEFIAERVAELGDGWHTASDLARGQVDAPSTGAIGAVYAKMVTPHKVTGDLFTVEGIVAGRNEKGSAAFHAA